jgi:hypothetical protein
MLQMKDGAILANSGHFNVEISIPDLEAASVEKRKVREGVEEYKLQDGRRLYLLSEGRLINLAAAEGHPSGFWVPLPGKVEEGPNGRLEPSPYRAIVSGGKCGFDHRRSAGPH